MTIWPGRRASMAFGTAVILVASSFALSGTSGAVVAGAGFTTFDTTVGGCNQGPNPNGINCNNYDDKDSVYMSGGPSAAGLSDGSYYFAVLVPGTQNGGFIEGADGNLSDITVGATVGDLGSGDDVTNRTFTIAGHDITSNGGTHLPGTSPNGRAIIGLAPFDDTSNSGGVYILAICQVGATSPSQCKYDAFKVRTGDEDTGDPFGVLSGTKYYDANTNGQLDPGEVGIALWPINYTDGVSGTILTDAAGTFSADMTPDTYAFAEQSGASPWMQTGNTVDQTSTTGVGGSATLNADKTYTVVVDEDSDTSGLNFGNVCIGGGGGGLTLGFWSNKNGQATMNDGGTLAPELTLLAGLNLRKANGSPSDPATYAAFRTWLLNATATNMAYMLSAQLAAMELNVEAGFVNGSSLIYAPGTTSANSLGFATVSAVMAEANTELGLHGSVLDGSSYRTYQEALKNALDRANNNLNFVQADASTCPAPPAPPA